MVLLFLGSRPVIKALYEKAQKENRMEKGKSLTVMALVKF